MRGLQEETLLYKQESIHRPDAHDEQGADVQEVLPGAIISFEAKMNPLDLYRKLRDAGFPQGGRGYWIQSPNSDEKVYVPKPEELYSQFLGDPQQWDALTDALAQAWIDYSKKNKV